MLLQFNLQQFLVSSELNLSSMNRLDASSSKDYVNLSFISYGFWWLILLSVHVLTCLYNASFAKFYWKFGASVLSYTLEAYSVGISRENFPMIAYSHTVLASIHGVCALHMLVGLIWRHPKRKTHFSKRIIVSSMPSSQMNIESPRLSQELDQDRARSVVARNIMRLYTIFGDRHGLFGVNGTRFHTIVICRKIVQTALRSVQAVRMSKFLPHPQLNHFFVALLIANCWSFVFIYSRWFWQGEAKRRFALLLCDCALDMMATIGMLAVIVLGYLDQLNNGMAEFILNIFEDDNLAARVLNEAQMILIVSWSDMATRIVYSLGLISTTTNMKELINYKPMKKRPLGLEVTSQSMEKYGLGPEVANQSLSMKKNEPKKSLGLSKTNRAITPCSESVCSDNETRSLRRKNVTIRHPTKKKYVEKFNLLFVFWGFAVLALHLQAIIKAPLSVCAPLVHPMAGALPSCFVVDFNCYKMGISGTGEEVHRKWTRFDRETAVKLHILHCSAFEMPTTLQDFSKLQEIVVYNSTIADWGDTASLTNSLHPRLTSVSVARSALANGILPLGLQSIDFPAALLSITFYDTNLQGIPDDIDSKWHLGSIIYIENSNLTSVPSALIRVQPRNLMLGGNPITEFPPELFDITGLFYIGLSRTKISILPRSISNPDMNTPFVDVRNTAISFFWSWIDPLVEKTLNISPMIIASDSIYCSDLDQIMAGTLDTFSTPLQTDFSQLLMNSSMENWELLRQAVNCVPLPFESYLPIEDWDKSFSLTQQT